jgi:hypothetical protein
MNSEQTWTYSVDHIKKNKINALTMISAQLLLVYMQEEEQIIFSSLCILLVTASRRLNILTRLHALSCTLFCFLEYIVYKVDSLIAGRISEVKRRFRCHDRQMALSL